MDPQLFWDRGGAGEPLVLVHGIGTTHDDFASLRDQLQRDYAVFAVDLPGQGRSPAVTGKPTVPALADAIEADLDARGLERVHLLGNSLGGRIALELARRGRARSVVAISPSGMALPPERALQGVTLSAARLVLRPLRRLIAPASRHSASRALLLAGFRSHPWRASETEARALRDGLAGDGDYWRMVWWALILDVPEGLWRIDVPVILAQGTADVLAPGQALRFVGLVPTAKFRALRGAGHAPHSDTPSSITDLVGQATAAAAPAEVTGPGKSL